MPIHKAAAEITHIPVTASIDIGSFRGKAYREVQATMEGTAPGGAYSVPIVAVNHGISLCCSAGFID